MSDTTLYKIVDEQGSLDSIFDDKELAEYKLRKKNYLSVDDESFILDKEHIDHISKEDIKYIEANIFISGNVKYHHPTLLCDPYGIRESDGSDDYDDNYYNIDISTKDPYYCERDVVSGILRRIPGLSGYLTEDNFKDAILNKVNYYYTDATIHKPGSGSIRLELIDFTIFCNVFVESLLHKNESRYSLDFRITDLVRKDFISKLSKNEFRLKYIADHK